MLVLSYPPRPYITTSYGVYSPNVSQLAISKLINIGLAVVIDDTKYEGVSANVMPVKPKTLFEILYVFQVTISLLIKTIEWSFVSAAAT